MIMIIVIFLLSGLIEHTSSISCYTCSELNNYCPVHFNIDGGDESNEADVETYNYDSGHACLSDQTYNPRTGERKVILRGIEHCREVNIPNRRVHCCYRDNCNKHPPTMNIRTLADMMGESTDIESHCQHYIPSIILICFSIILQYFY